MTITQVAEFLNAGTQAVLGENATVINEDLSNVVDVGREITNVDNWRALFLKGGIDRIGRWHYVNRVYSGVAPSLFLDSWVYGSIMAKFWSKMKQDVDNPSLQLTDGMDYSPNIYHENEISGKFWNKETTHSVENSIPDFQYNEALSGPDEAAALVAMLMNDVTNKLEVDNEYLIMSVIRNMVASVVNARRPMQVVNLLTGYNATHTPTLTQGQAMESADFMRYAVRVMQLTAKRMKRMSTLFNVGGQQRFTPEDRLRVIWLDEFLSAVGVYLYNAPSQFNRDYLGLPAGDSVPYWQAPADNYTFVSDSTVNVTIDTGDGSTSTVNQTGVVAIMFDHWAMGVCNDRPRTLTNYVVRAEFTNYFHKRRARYFNDTNENAVVFIVA